MARSGRVTGRTTGGTSLLLTYSIATRSEVIDIAVRSLFERELESAYAEASREEEQFRAFESTSADGIEDDPAW